MTTSDETFEPAKEDAEAEAQGQEGHERNPMNEIAPNRGLSLSLMQRLFDETAEGNMERRQAIADCMGLPLAPAIKESERRIHEAESPNP
jgi:hypothetical protein